ncbi:hypothetical protein ACVISU_005526 [Bradyrhizobium sp. USDA 4452]
MPLRLRDNFEELPYVNMSMSMSRTENVLKHGWLDFIVRHLGLALRGAGEKFRKAADAADEKSVLLPSVAPSPFRYRPLKSIGVYD